MPANIRQSRTGSAWLLVPLLISCTSRAINSLQSAVDELAANRDAPQPGAILDRDVRGDWAYVRTAGPGVAGHGELVAVQTSQGRQWTVLSFATYEVAGNELIFRNMQFGGQLAQQKEKTLDKALKEVAIKKWNDYLMSERLTVAKPKGR